MLIKQFDKSVQLGLAEFSLFPFSVEAERCSPRSSDKSRGRVVLHGADGASQMVRWRQVPLYKSVFLLQAWLGHVCRDNSGEARQILSVVVFPRGAFQHSVFLKGCPFI